MDNTKQDFENRKAEIENYFKFLIIFDNDDTKLQYKKDGNLILERIEPKFQTILIANAFLILYNLIESTVRNSLIEIYTAINKDDAINYENLSENLKKIWIEQNTDNLKEGSFRPDTLRNYVFNLAKDILSNETILLANKMDFSGNLDARKVKDIANKVGFEEPVGGDSLVRIKNKRNRLAHGEQTFYDAGENFTVGEITNFKDETFSYLSDVITKIEAFITESAYKND